MICRGQGAYRGAWACSLSHVECRLTAAALARTGYTAGTCPFMTFIKDRRLRTALCRCLHEEKRLLREARSSVSQLLTLVEEYPQNVHYTVAAARALFTKGKGQGREHARELFGRALESGEIEEELHAHILVTWATCAMKAQLYDEAEELLNRCDASRFVSVSIARAQLMERRGQLDRAKELYFGALEMNPNDVVALSALANLLSHGEAKNKTKKASKERNDEADVYFKRATIVKPRDGTTWCSWAQHEWRNGRYAKAKDIFEQGISQAPHHAPLFVAYAKMEAQRRNRNKARALLKSAASAAPNHLHVWITWSQLEGREGDVDKALELCQHALDIDPSSIYALCSMGQTLAAANRLDEAMECWEKALSVDPECAVAAHELGHAVQRTSGDFERAESYFGMGSRSTSDPKGAQRCAIALAEAKVSRGQMAEARRVLASVEQLHRPTGRYLRCWAAIEKRLGDLQAASVLFRRAAESDPRDERTWLQWGQLERRRGDGEAALRCWRAGLQVSPANPYLWQSYATGLWQVGRAEEGRDAFGQAVRKCPGNQQLLLAWALEELGVGNGEAALGILRLGWGGEGGEGGNATREVHQPLLAAHARIAEELGYAEEAESVRARMNASTA